MRSWNMERVAWLLLGASALALGACGGGEPEGSHGGPPGGASQAGHARSGPGEGMPGGGGAPRASVPVEVAPVVRRAISSYIETNGTLEAENEVDIVARVSAPVVELRTEEGREVGKGQVLARLDDREIEARAEISRVNLEEARLARERAEELKKEQLISPEEYEAAVARFETAEAQYESDRIQLGYTQIEAPFRGLIVTRYVDLAQQVSVNTALFRISDFDPLLCPIRVPERELPRLSLGQKAYLTLEAWPGERFPAEVLRISPVVDATTGTVKVTLDVEAGDRLRPGMFARVFLETETRDGALVIPRTALSLESIGDTVYVAAGGAAARREVELGFREGDYVEVLSGVAEGEQVVVVGQDGLSEGTPIQTLGGVDSAAPEHGPADTATAPGADGAGPPGKGGGGGAGRGMGFDPSQMTPEQLERMKGMMRQRGLSDEEIEERLERMRSHARKGSEPQ